MESLGLGDYFMSKNEIITSKEFKTKLKRCVESSNINFILGAGFSHGIVDTLGNTEKILEAIHQNNKENKYTVIEAYVFWKFFKSSIKPLIDNVNDSKLTQQIEFIKLWNEVINNRESAVINKQINVFTTNYDVVLEYAFENTFIDYNDGFKGRIDPYFSTTNFNRLYFERGLFTNRCIETSIFNLLKLHGSVTWKIENSNNSRIIYNEYRSSINNFYNKYEKFFTVESKKIFDDIETLMNWFEDDSYDEEYLNAILLEEYIKIDKECTEFIDDYKKTFKIVNPTKQKFNDTLMDKNYYELMRIYCNELERNNTVLIAFGFSFEDEHIREMTLRALGNPSLTLIIFAFSKKDAIRYNQLFNKYNNVWIVQASESNDEEIDGEEKKEKLLDLEMLNRSLKDIFGEFNHGE